MPPKVLVPLVAAALTLLACALIVAPHMFGVERWLIVSQLVALRGLVAIALGVVAVCCIAVAAGVRRVRIVAVSMAVVLALAASVSLGVLSNRGLAVAQPADGELVVVSWNTHVDSPGAQPVAELVREHDADIVVLPETSTLLADEVVAMLKREGKTMTAHAAFDAKGFSETSLLVDESLGAYEWVEAAGSTPALPSGVWKPSSGTGPTIVAAHPFPPLPGGMSDWRTGLEWIADQCTGLNVIVAGDLNATVDHWPNSFASGELGDCFDAAIAVDAAALGTWPTSLPPALGAPIDHVLATSQWKPLSFTVVTDFDSLSDHRPVVAVFD